MAGAEQLRDAGKRLAVDLRELRTERGIDADAILEATRLSSDIFQAFELTALVDHPAFNRVYLRSIVSTYARVLQIEEADVLAALEQALDGRYHGALRQKYLARFEPESGPSFTLVQEDSELEDLEGPGDSKSDHTREEPIRHSGPPVEVIRKPYRRAMVWLFILVVAVIFVLAWILGNSSDSDSASISPSEPAPPATAEEAPLSPEPTWIVLGDSIRFDVIAAVETIDPVRVTLDEDMRRPYWIEYLDTLTFYVTNKIVFERELESADILMEGYLLSDSLIDADGQLILNRDRAQAWLDSLVVRTASGN